MSPSSAALWRGYLARNRRPASRRPRSGSVTNNNQATTRLGGKGVGFVGGPAATTNAVAGTNMPNATANARTWRGGDVL